MILSIFFLESAHRVRLLFCDLVGEMSHARGAVAHVNARGMRGVRSRGFQIKEFNIIIIHNLVRVVNDYFRENVL